MLELAGKSVTILGAGRSARAAFDLLCARGARPAISSSAPIPEDFRSELENRKTPFEEGGHSERLFLEAALIIVSPGAPLNLPVLDAAAKAGVPIAGELELASWFCERPILAITGTNGKTTATRLLQHLLHTSGRKAVLAGNNDTPFASIVDSLEDVDFVVLEVSSYQLESVQSFHPHIGVVLNITPDHLARHGSLEAYARAKARLFARQTEEDFALLNADDPGARSLELGGDACRRCFSIAKPVSNGIYLAGDEVLDQHGTLLGSLAAASLPGAHNRENMLAVIAVMDSLGIAPAAFWEGLQTFPAVEHRIEPVAMHRGVRIYNDSKSTNIDSLRVALMSFEDPIVLIAGGVGKGAPYESLVSLAAERLRAIIAIGEDGPKIAAALGAAVPVETMDSMAGAVRAALRRAQEGDVVLLSPACASFDWYENFEARGRDFKQCVQAVMAETDTASGPVEISTPR